MHNQQFSGTLGLSINLVINPSITVTNFFFFFSPFDLNYRLAVLVLQLNFRYGPTPEHPWLMWGCGPSLCESSGRKRQLQEAGWKGLGFTSLMG